MTGWKIELVVGNHGEPVQATVVRLVDGETVAIVTQAVEPFVSWTEVMDEILDNLPVQLRML